MAFRPRKRAETQLSPVYWQSIEEKRLLGFAGYKAGMTQVSYIDESASPSKGQEVMCAATVLEIPPLYVYGIRGYKNKQTMGDLLCDDKKMLALIGIKNKKTKEWKLEEAEQLALLVFAQPFKTGIGKKHPERMEIAIGGKDRKEKLDYAKSMIGKEIRVKDVFKPGEYVDTIAVTKGKGWQGAVRRFGVSKQRPKATGKRRHVGTLGQWHPAYVLYTIPQAGQMGYHTRTELNKQILKIGENGDEINPAGGFPHFGVVKNDYLILKGSIPGPAKRLIRLRLAIRGGDGKEPKLTYTSLESKQ